MSGPQSGESSTAYRDEDFGAWLNSEDGYVDELLISPDHAVGECVWRPLPG